MTSQAASERDSAPCDRWLALGLALAFLLLYLRTLCPTVYLGDSGEICTAVVTGGVIHPPGYPLLSVLGRLCLLLIPWGEPAFRIGCGVALAAGAAIGVLYLLARSLGASPWASLVGTTAFGLSRVFWSQSTRVEVYSLHVLLVCLVLLTAVRFRQTGEYAWLAGLILAGSLGLAHHLTIVLLGPGLLVLCLPTLRSAGLTWPRLGFLAALLATGPALYLLLLAWARAEPLEAWGHTVTLPLLWNHASARFYRGLLQWPDSGFILHRLRGTWSLFNDTFPAMTGLLALLGAGRLCCRDRGLGIALLLVPAVVIAYNFCYRIDDIAPYYLSAWLVCAALIALALDSARSLLRTRGGTATLIAAAIGLLIGLPLYQNWESCNLSHSTWVREFASHKLQNADPGSVLITATDNDTFPVWYVHDLLKVRPDVLHLDREVCRGTWASYRRDPSLWYLHRLRRQGVDAPMAPPRDRARWQYLAEDGYLIDLLQGPLRGRPICITFFGTGAPPDRDRQVFFHWAAARYRPLPVGIILRLHPKERPVDLQALLRDNERQWAQMTLPDLSHARTDDELDPDYVSHHYACSLVNFGGLHEMAGHVSRAEALYRIACEWAPGYKGASDALTAVRVSRKTRRHPSPAG